MSWLQRTTYTWPYTDYIRVQYRLGKPYGPYILYFYIIKTDKTCIDRNSKSQTERDRKRTNRERKEKKNEKSTQTFMEKNDFKYGNERYESAF